MPLDQNQFIDTFTLPLLSLRHNIIISFWSFIPPVDLVSHKLLKPQGKTSGRFPQTVCFVQTWVGGKTDEKISPLPALMIMPDQISLHQLVARPPNICPSIDDNLIGWYFPIFPAFKGNTWADLLPIYMKVRIWCCFSFLATGGDLCYLSTPLNSTLTASSVNWLTLGLVPWSVGIYYTSTKTQVLSKLLRLFVL